MRIASLVPSATEMLFALGLGEGRALYTLNEGLLAELAPDLIVTQAVCEVCAVSYDDVVEVAGRLAGRPRVLQQDPSTLGEVLDDLIRLGEAAGRPVVSHGLRQSLEGRLDAVRRAVEDEPRPRVLALEWLDPPFLGGHWIPEMIEIAGGEDIAGRPGHKSPQVAWEDLRSLDPDVVVSMPCGWYLEDSCEQALAQRERLDSLGGSRVYAVDAASTFSRPGPRLVDGVELLGHLFHPTRVEPPQGIGFAELTAQISRS